MYGTGQEHHKHAALSSNSYPLDLKSEDLHSICFIAHRLDIAKRTC